MIHVLQNGQPSALLANYFIPVVSWIHTHKWPIIGAILAAPAAALIQGAYFLARYRLQYGDDAPVPLLPAHGVAVVNPTDASLPETEATDREVSESSSLCSLLFGHDGGSHHPDIYEVKSEGSTNGRFSATGTSSKAWGSTRRRGSVSDWTRIRRAAEAPPLRLLMIGDSLAAGVGVSKSCTPLLPETIAKSLSKALGGRAVYWTCIAEPGASSGWIVRELEKFQTDEVSVQSNFTTTASQGTLSVANLLEDDQVPSSDRNSAQKNGIKEGVFIDEASERLELEEWRDRLSLHSKRLKSEVFGEFDVVCIMTGLNDLKGAIMPWLLQGDEIEFRRQARERGGDYTSELKRVVDAVAEKMKAGLRESLDRVRTSVDNIRDRIGASIHASSTRPSAESERRPLLGKQLDESQPNKASPDEDNIMYPLVVLPALPSNLPVLQVPPFIWFLLPLIHMADRIKRKLAERYPHAILYVDAPNPADMLEFENRRGPCWDKMVKEDTLLSLKDTSSTDRERVEKQMREYYTKKGKRQIRTVRRRGAHHPTSVVQPANVRLGAPGASLLSLDGIHPNDKGYDFWGRFIAAAIVREWNIRP